MRFFSLTPDVPGDLGEQSVLDTSMHPPQVHTFHLDVTNWSGDDLVECFPCFAVSPRLGASLKSAGMTGYSLGPMETTVNPDQFEVNPTREVPRFQRLIVSGKAGRDDAGIDASYQLVVSQRLWGLLSQFNVGACDVEPWAG